MGAHNAVSVQWIQPHTHISRQFYQHFAIDSSQSTPDLRVLVIKFSETRFSNCQYGSQKHQTSDNTYMTTHGCL